MIRIIVAGSAVLLVGFAIGRSVTPERTRTVREVHHHDHSMPEPPPPTVEEKKTAVREVDEVASALRNAAERDRTEKLNEMQQVLAGHLIEGTLDAGRILDMFRGETDPRVLDVLVAALRSHPPSAQSVLPEFLELAERDLHPARRQAAVVFLGSSWDQDGEVFRILMEIAGRDRERGVRLAVAGAMRDYFVRNPGRAADPLLAFARRSTDDEIRALSISALPTYGSDELVREAGTFLGDPSPDVRLSAAESIGNGRPTARSQGLKLLRGAHARESEVGIRSALVLHIVRLGRTDAIPTLKSLTENHPMLRRDINHYIAVLETGEMDLPRILEGKDRMDRRP